MSKLHILHTNDFHNHLDAAQGAVIQQAKARFENVLLLDAGDAVSAGNLGVRPGGEPILTLMSEVGYDAMTLGNREFHIAESLLRCKISKAQFPILCANMRWKEDTGNRLPVEPYLIKTLPNGLRAGIFGLTVPMVTTRMAARAVSAFVFNDPLETAFSLVNLLRPQVDLVIALTHIGYREDQKLAQLCSGIDLIIGGHSHVVLQAPEWVSGVPLVQAGWYGHYWGDVEIECEAGTPAVVRSGFLHSLDQRHQS